MLPALPAALLSGVGQVLVPSKAAQAELLAELATIDVKLRNVTDVIYKRRSKHGSKTFLNTTDAALLKQEIEERARRRAFAAEQRVVRKRLDDMMEQLSNAAQDESTVASRGADDAALAVSQLLAHRPLEWRSRVYIYNVSLERDFQLSPSQVRAYESILNNDKTGIVRHMPKGLGAKLLRIRLGVSERTHPDGWLHQHLAARLGASVTTDPAQADFFWLPVWSYALCTAVSDKLDGILDLDSHMQQSTYAPCSAMVRVIDWLQHQPYWRRNRGADHLYIMNYKDRMSRSGRKRVKDQQARNTLYALVANSIFVATEDRHALPKLRLGTTSVVVPYYADLYKWGGGGLSFDQLIEGKNRLITFVGNRKGKICHLERGACPKHQSIQTGGPSVAGTTRAVIQQSIATTNGTVIDLDRLTPQKMAFSDANALLQSVFCPCPLGDTYTSKRIFTAVQALCIPIIVSDGMQVPYTRVGIPWSNFSMTINETDILMKRVNIVEAARKIPSSRVRQMQLDMWRARPLLTFSRRTPGGPPDATTVLLEELQLARRTERIVLMERLGSAPCMHGVSFGLENVKPQEGQQRMVWVADGCHGIFAFFKDGQLCDEGPREGRWCDRIVCSGSNRSSAAHHSISSRRDYGAPATRTLCPLSLHGT